MRSRPAGICAIVGSTAVLAFSFAIVLGGPAVAWATAPTVAVTTLFAQSAGGNNSCCIEVDISTTVTIRAQISNWNDPSVKAGSLTVRVIQQKDNGSESAVCTMKDSASIGTGQGSSGHNLLTGIFVCQQTFTETLSTFIRLVVRLNYTLTSKQPSGSDSAPFFLYVGKTVDPATDTTIPGDGFTITVHAGTFEPGTSAFVSGHICFPTIFSPTCLTGVDLGGKQVETALQLKVEDPVSGIDLTDATAGFDIAVPTTLANMTKLLVAQPVDTGAPTLTLVQVAKATVTGGDILTDPPDPMQPGLSGVHESGTFAFVLDLHSGYVTGTVREGSSTGPVREGVIVSNSTNTLTAVTDANGVYTLFLDDATSGQYTLTAKDPFRCTGFTTVPSSIPVGGGTVTGVNIVVSPSASEASRPGVRNAGFEHGDLACWTVTGNVSIAPQLGPTGNYSPSGTLCKSINRSGTTYSNVCSPSTSAGGVTIFPDEGSKMAVLSTAGSGPATMSQTFTVPNGVSTLRMKYNYVSEELPEWAGSARPFDDPFKIYIAKEGQATSDTPCSQLPQPIPTTFTSCLVDQVTVDSAAALSTTTFIGDCLFTGGDTTCSQTGWREAAVDLSNFGVTSQTSQKIVLTFTVANAGDTLYATQVLVDNIRFKTVWVDVKVVDGATSTGLPTINDRITRDLLRTSDILSQAGVNVQRRPTIQTVSAGTGGTLPSQAIDVSHQLDSVNPNCVVNNIILVGLDLLALQNKHLTTTSSLGGTPEALLMTQKRSSNGQDINVYYVNSAVGVSGVSGWTANKGDFCSDVKLFGEDPLFPAGRYLGAMITNLASSKTTAHELSHALIKAVSSGTLLHGATAGTVANVTTLSPTIQPAQSAAMQQSPNLQN
jgi:hypothetical protein